jgi:hypothetical protein
MKQLIPERMILSGLNLKFWGGRVLTTRVALQKNNGRGHLPRVLNQHFGWRMAANQMKTSLGKAPCLGISIRVNFNSI